MAVAISLAIASTFAVVAYGKVPLISSLQGGLSRWVSHSEGLTLVYEDESPELDIVCVHGLGGDPNQTWEWREHGSVVNWTKDLLPGAIDNVQVRVLTYGYSSKLFTGARGRRSRRSVDGKVLRYLPQALYLHSNRLIEQLADARTGDAQKRPVIFVAHSLGGLIVKSALVYASAAVGERYQRLKAIELLTAGVLFFGTPQRELLWKTWSDLLERMFRVAALTPLDAIIQPLKEQAELFNLQIQRYKSIEVNFLNFSFCENVKSTVKGTAQTSTDTLIVQQDEAIPILSKSRKWEKIIFNRTHSELVRFSSKEDPDFEKVALCLCQCVKDSINRDIVARYMNFFNRMPRSSSSPDIKSKILDPSADDEWGKIRSKLCHVDSLDSKEIVKAKQDQNKNVLNQSEKVNGLCGIMTLLIVEEIANNAFEAREYESAEAWYKRLFVAVQEIHSPCSEDAVDVLKKIVEVAIRQGRLVEATDTLAHARDIQRKRGVNGSDILQLTERIASLHWSRGLLDEALVEYEDLIANVQKISEEMDDEMLRLKKLEANVWRQKGKRDRIASKTARIKENEVQRLEDRLKHSKTTVD